MINKMMAKTHTDTEIYIFLIPQIICILRANGFPFALPVKVGADFDLTLGAWELQPNEIWTIVFVS